MKKVVAIFLALLFIFCCTDRLVQLPYYWEYSPGKWILFKETFKIDWKNTESKIDNFRIYRDKIKLKDVEIKKIIKLIRKNKIEDLVALETSFREKIKISDRVEYVNSSEKFNFTDNKDSAPTYGEIFFYQISTIKDGYSSLPAGISVILLDRSK